MDFISRRNLQNSAKTRGALSDHELFKRHAACMTNLQGCEFLLVISTLGPLVATVKARNFPNSIYRTVHQNRFYSKLGLASIIALERRNMDYTASNELPWEICFSVRGIVSVWKTFAPPF
jgi:hypothetical protein